MNNSLIEELSNKYHLELLLLFGSRADGSHHEKSDYDVAYLSSEKLDLKSEARLIVDLAPIFRSEQIDLINLKTAPPLLYYAIFRKNKVIYEKEPLLFASLRVYAFKKYVEAKPLFEERHRRLQKSLTSRL